jgi:hypothetical protein
LELSSCATKENQTSPAVARNLNARHWLSERLDDGAAAR